MIDPMVRISDVRACGLCVKGARAWFEKHNLSFKYFLEWGYPASVIEGTKDQLGLQVAAKARERESSTT